MTAEAQALLDVGQGLIDIALAWTPGVGLARDVCEVVTGRDLITGEALSDFERFAAAVGVITGGFGSKVLNGVDAVSRIARQDREAVRAILSRAERLVAYATSAGLNPRFIERTVATKIANRHTLFGKYNSYPPHNGIFLQTENIEELALDAWRYGVRRPDFDVSSDGVRSIVKDYDFGRPIGYRRDTLKTTSRVRVLVFPDSRQFRNAFPITVD